MRNYPRIEEVNNRESKLLAERLMFNLNSVLFDSESISSYCQIVGAGDAGQVVEGLPSTHKALRLTHSTHANSWAWQLVLTPALGRERQAAPQGWWAR